MNKVYSPINWRNYPNEDTPINEANLNKMDAAIDIIDSRVVMQEATKLDKTTANTMIKDVTFDNATGVITVTKLNGSVLKIDTKLEKLAVNFSYDSENQRLVITLDDGTTQYVDLKALITQYEFVDGNTIVFTADSSGKITAEIKDGSITADKLDPNVLAQINISVSKAESAAKKAEENYLASKSYAVGGTETREGEDADNSKYYSEVAEGLVEQANAAIEEANKTLEEVGKKVTETVFRVNLETGKLEYDSPNYVFMVNHATGKLEWEVS